MEGNKKKKKKKGRKGKERVSNERNALIFHHRYASDKSLAPWSVTDKKTIENRSERHFYASCSLLYRHPSMCTLDNRIFLFLLFFTPFSKAHQRRQGQRIQFLREGSMFFRKSAFLYFCLKHARPCPSLEGGGYRWFLFLSLLFLLSFHGAKWKLRYSNYTVYASRIFCFAPSCAGYKEFRWILRAITKSVEIWEKEF